MSNVAVFKISRCSECVHYRFRYHIGCYDLQKYMNAECLKLRIYFDNENFDQPIPDWCPFLETEKEQQNEQG